MTQPLPPMMQLAVDELRKAMTEPPSLGDKWPFANPPGLAAALEGKNNGRPSSVEPNQVIRLVRAVRQGESIAQAAARLGLTRSVASRVLSGQHAAAHSAAVEAAGIFLAPLKAASARAKAVQNADCAPGHTQVAPQAPKSPTGPISAGDGSDEGNWW